MCVVGKLQTRLVLILLMCHAGYRVAQRECRAPCDSDGRRSKWARHHGRNHQLLVHRGKCRVYPCWAAPHSPASR